MIRKKSDAHFDRFDLKTSCLLISSGCLCDLSDREKLQKLLANFKLDQDQLVGQLVGIYSAAFLCDVSESLPTTSMSSYLVLAAVATAVFSYPTGRNHIWLLSYLLIHAILSKLSIFKRHLRWMWHHWCDWVGLDGYVWVLERCW